MEYVSYDQTSKNNRHTDKYYYNQILIIEVSKIFMVG